MFNKKTTIIVGAGASNEVNLPTGYELKHKISNILDFKFDDFGHSQKSGDKVVLEAIQHAVRKGNPNLTNIDPYIEASWRIRDAMPISISIDNFIDAHKGNGSLELCGKLAIVKSILEAESKSLLFIDTQRAKSTLNYKLLEKTWFNSFMNLLTENCTIEQLEERLSTIELIIFNYDRCIEHYLYHSLQTYYDIDHNKAASLVQGIKIFHPYGTVGNLPWYGGRHVAAFGCEVSAVQLVELAGQIKTFTEGTDPESSNIERIRKSISESQIVIFLGFAYHRLNLKLIKPPEDNRSNQIAVQYFGTAKGISDSDCNVISTELNQLVGANRGLNINLRNDLNCSGLFQEYWRSLSLS